MARRDYWSRRNRDRNIPGQSHLVSAMELESVLRKGLCRNSIRSSGDPINAGLGRTIRDHRSQRKTRRRIACTSTARIRQVEARSGPASPVSGRSPIGFAKAFHARVGLVFANTSRWREMAMAQLSGQSAFRSAEPISLVHGQYSPPAEPKGLRLLRDAARCFTEKVRSSPRRFEDSGTKANSATAFRGWGIFQGNDRFI